MLTIAHDAGKRWAVFGVLAFAAADFGGKRQTGVGDVPPLNSVLC